MNPMLSPRIAKVTINMGIGKAGEPLDNAVKIMESLAHQKPVRTITQKRIPTWDVRPGTAIGCMVTLRGKKAMEFLKLALEAVSWKVKASSFDNHGNFAFGVKEHIDIPGVKYDPKLGVYGLDVCVTIEKPGYRVGRRYIPSPIGKHHLVKKVESIEFAKKLGVNVI